MLKLSAFADEISAELDEQIRVCRECGVTHIQLRNVRGVNVLDFNSELRTEIRSKLRDNGMGVVSIVFMVPPTLLGLGMALPGFPGLVMPIWLAIVSIGMVVSKTAKA